MLSTEYRETREHATCTIASARYKNLAIVTGILIAHSIKSLHWWSIGAWSPTQIFTVKLLIYYWRLFVANGVVVSLPDKLDDTGD